MKKVKLIYEGKAKRVYSTEEDDKFIIEFKDSATAFDGLKKAEIQGKGEANCAISSKIFELLTIKGVRNHYIERLNEREMLVRSVKIFPIEVIIRNRVAGSMAKRLGLEEGRKLEKPILEFCYKSDELHDPMINEDHISALGLASPEELITIKDMSLKTNQILIEFFKLCHLDLVDMKFEFGKDSSGEIYLADEISPDTCRLWELGTTESWDKDRFRRDLGGVEEAYNEVKKRVLETPVESKTRILIRLKQGILDAQGSVILNALKSLGFNEVLEVRVGKLLEIKLDRKVDEAGRIERMCRELLANPVMEDYEWEWIEE
ncbi:MAG TPA: phosphoribosylaminoimidazolesuccinocarboxamide synthase [bacterium]|nr:phosphoribosylaminoimidazolesuccinocarboxamide synthase [bacterium]HPC77688.1 phosphoribosylaminoimidazolesuccinocarboxamide synthase [bacterium]HRR91266.1 phosphoribosylaminoimidazolesuccinocarboxamide synthase [bacterium]